MDLDNRPLTYTPARCTPGPAIWPTTSTIPGADIDSSASITLICTLVSGPSDGFASIWRRDGDSSSPGRGISAVLWLSLGRVGVIGLSANGPDSPGDDAPGSTSISSSLPFIAPTPAGSGATIARASRPYESVTRIDSVGEACSIEKSKLIRCWPGVLATSISLLFESPSKIPADLRSVPSMKPLTRTAPALKTRDAISILGASGILSPSGSVAGARGAGAVAASPPATDRETLDEGTCLSSAAIFSRI